MMSSGTLQYAYVERTAWLVLLIAFLVLCTICIGSTLGVYVFLFQSTIPMDVTLGVGRGTALLTDSDFNERGVRSDTDISGRVTTISLDSQSQASLLVSIPTPIDETATTPSENLLTAITLKNGSDMRFRLAEMPRFSWTNAPYHLILRDFSGRMDVLVTEQDDHYFQMEIYTATNTLILINGSGRYAIDANPERVKVITYDGEAVLYGKKDGENRVVPKGMEAVVFAERSEPTLSPTRSNLLENGLFSIEMPLGDTETSLPGRWGCTTVQDSSPRGVYSISTWKGQSALRLVRADGADNHGETRCLQPIDNALQDVSGYSYLELESSFLINYQSVSDCGIKGSECPMMLRMTYMDINGNPQEWFQGFYYATNPNLGYPPRCASCTQDHIQINEKVWYTFESGNLFNAIPATIRPAKILTVELYASGHQFDLFVSEIALLIGYADAVPEVSGTN